jgi:hypothetical protein
MAMAGKDRDDTGWQSDSSPDDYRNYSSSGRGAVTHGRGEGQGGRGTDYDEALSPEEAEARQGEAAPEFPPVGWGGKDENYPPARSPADGPQPGDGE